MWMFSDKAAMVYIAIVVCGLWYLKPEASRMMTVLFIIAAIGSILMIWFLF